MKLNCPRPSLGCFGSKEKGDEFKYVGFVSGLFGFVRKPSARLLISGDQISLIQLVHHEPVELATVSLFEINNLYTKYPSPVGSKPFNKVYTPIYTSIGYSHVGLLFPERV